MSCSPFDLRDYVFEELKETERRSVEHHVRTCEACREELHRLQLTQSALLALRDEEIPQRIAFVSDKVFEPSRLRRWMQSFWSSAARLTFASAAMLSIAIVASAWLRPAPVIAPAPPAVDRASLEAEFSRRLQQAMAEIEERQSRKTAELVKAAERRFEMDTLALRLEMANTVELMRKRVNVIRLARNDLGAEQQ